jgi:hypothetical protein
MDSTIPPLEPQPNHSDANHSLPATPASTTTWLWQVLNAPITIGLGGRFKNLMNFKFNKPATIASIVTEAGLPAELAAIVEQVVRATRLWSSERRDVARELAAHFRDGLEAGASASDLRDQFGDVATIAKLIRRARIRCRSVVWHAWRYGLAGLALLLLAYSGLIVRFALSYPTISRNFLKEQNDLVRSTPEDQRAWPIQRTALKQLVPYRKLDETERMNLQEGWWTSETNRVEKDLLAWNQMLEFVESNQAVIEQLHLGANKPIRGVIYGDPIDSPNLPDMTGEDRPLVGVLLPQAQSLRTAQRLLTADATVARSRGEADRFTRDILSVVKLAELCRGFCLIEDLVAVAILTSTFSIVLDTCEDFPSLLTDDQLIAIAHRLASFLGGGTIRFDLSGEKAMAEDILQRCYSDDGRGDGILTAAGIKFLSENLLPSTKVNDNIVFPSQIDGLALHVVGPAIALQAESRRQTQEAIDLLFAKAAQRHRGPLHSWEQEDQREGRQKESDLNAASIMSRFSIPSIVFPAFEQCDKAAERFCQLRDGTLTAIALELYRRQYGGWPDHLEHLVPGYMPTVPLDRFTGQSLRYRLQDGKPLVYACGMDQQDDGGRSTSIDGGDFHTQVIQKPEKQPAIGEGYDWVLFPRPRKAINH